MKRLLILVFLLIPAASALSSIDVLSVSEQSEIGGVATAHLATRPGSGSVFIDSYPLTRLDTQLSVRFAREYACDLAQVDCSSVDFFYTIRAGTTILGGPSAGAALTVLTYSELEDLDINRSVTMTGTVTGGGLVGPVGGIHEKVVAARDHGFTKVLVPVAEIGQAGNVSSIEVVGVSSIEEALLHFTGENVDLGSSNIIVPDAYTAQMEDVAVQLCERSEMLSSQVSNVSNQTDTWMVRSREASAQQKFYSAASFCFSANLRLQEQVLSNKSNAELQGVLGQLFVDIESFDDSLDSEFDSVGDLEVFMVVRERLVEAYDSLEDQNRSNISSAQLAFALERYSSAVAWSSFFGIVEGDQRFEDEWLERSCAQQLAAARERINYVSYLTGLELREAQGDVQNAAEYQRQEEWALCLFSSAKVQAQAQAVITAAYSGDVLNETVEMKRQRAGQLLARSTSEGVFPIMSYAYYEYAGEVNDVYSKNLYSEYAIALSTMDIYREAPGKVYRFDTSRVLLLLAGIILGLAAGIFVHSVYVNIRRK